MKTPAKRKTPYAWEVQWGAEPGGYVPKVNVAAWSREGAMRNAQDLMPNRGRPTQARNLDAPGMS